MQNWNRQIVWRVQHRLVNGEIDCRWFRREHAAREWAKSLAATDIVEVSIVARTYK